jgi:hypothetical protein
MGVSEDKGPKQTKLSGNIKAADNETASKEKNQFDFKHRNSMGMTNDQKRKSVLINSKYASPPQVMEASQQPFTPNQGKSGGFNTNLATTQTGLTKSSTSSLTALFQDSDAILTTARMTISEFNK